MRVQSGPEVIKLISCLTHLLSMKFKMLIDIEIVKIDRIFRFSHQSQSFILLINIKWHFNIYEQDKFHAHLS